MAKIYGTYRVSYYNKGEGKYYPSFRLDQQYADYKKAGLTKTLDMLIPENRYTAELVPGVRKEVNFIVGEYNEKYVNEARYKLNVQNVGAEFQIEMFETKEEAITWIKENTDLKEVEPGKFEINPAGTDIDGEETEATYLIIE